MANLLIDIGSTAVKASWADGMTLGKTFRYQGEKIMDFILSLTAKVKPETICMASVREISTKNKSILEKECSRLVILDGEILSNHGLPSYITADRAASILACWFLFKGKSCTIFDFGTVISTDFLSSEGEYLGGCISPGFRTRFRSINRYSKGLPLVSAPEKISSRGQSVQESISAGVAGGIIFEIYGQMADNPSNITVFTGGDAIYFAKRIKNSIFVVCNLVLMGLALIADEDKSENI